jgi:hypothetical protein
MQQDIHITNSAEVGLVRIYSSNNIGMYDYAPPEKGESVKLNVL